MAIPSEKLAQSLDVLRQLQESKNSPVIRSSEISRTHYERLVKNGFLMKVVGGWYIQSDPAAVSGDTTGDSVRIDNRSAYFPFLSLRSLLLTQTRRKHYESRILDFV